MKHLTIQDVTKEDHRFVVDKPEKGFSPEKNYAVIKEVLDDGVKFERQMKQAQKKEMDERVDILSTFGRYALGGGEKKLEDFMGKAWMHKIYGDKIAEKLRIAESIKRLNKSNGNTQFENYFLT